MKLTFRKHEVKNLSQLQTLLTEHAEAVEPGFRVLASTVNFGRSTVELVGLDGRGTPTLMGLGLTADDAMLFRMVEAYAWALEYPESVRRLVPAGGGGSWPPRVVFIAERLPESFVRKIRLLTFPAVDCFEYRCVEVNDTTGFYLDAVDWAASAPSPAPPPATPTAGPAHAEGVWSHAPTLLERRAIEPAQPAATGEAQPPRWFGLLTLGSTPVADTPAVAEPVRPVVLQPAESPHDTHVADSQELTPAWRKLLEKLASTFDARPAGDAPAAVAPEKTARPTPEPPKQPATAYAGWSKNGGSGRIENPRARALLEVVKLPANGELAPQWRKFLERPAIDDAKTSAAREYLHREFPMCTIYDFYDHQRNAHVLELHDNQGKISHQAAITGEFFEAHDEPEVRTVLESLRLSQAMRQAGQAGVLVTPSALEVQKR